MDDHNIMTIYVDLVVFSRCAVSAAKIGLIIVPC